MTGTNEQRLRFVVMTDGHWGQSEAYENNHEDALEVIDAIHAEREIDFFVSNGDIVHDDETYHQEVIDEFYSSLPTDDWYPVFGNHDWSTDEEWEADYGVPKNHTFEVEGYGCMLVETGRPRTAEGSGSYSPADPEFVEDAIDELAGTDGIFVFQHIAPFTETDVYGTNSPDVRAQYARDEVELVFLGHNHNKNFPEHVDGGDYVYACRVGGVDLGGANYPFLDDFGVRIVDVYEDGTIETVQLGLDTGPLNEETFEPPLPTARKRVFKDGTWVTAKR